MTFSDLSGFLAAQPLLALTVVAILLASLGWLLQASQPRAAHVLRIAGYAGMVGALLLTVVGAAFHATRSDMKLTMGRDRVVAIRDGETVVPLDADGHFWVTAWLDGAEQEFLIDTGATYTSISAATAARAGIRPDPLAMPVGLNTANGRIEARFAKARSLTFGSIEAKDLAIVIVPPSAGDTNVIGMNLLSRLAGWKVEDGKLILRPAPPAADDTP